MTRLFEPATERAEDDAAQARATGVEAIELETDIGPPGEGSDGTAAPPTDGSPADGPPTDGDNGFHVPAASAPAVDRAASAHPSTGNDARSDAEGIHIQRDERADPSPSRRRGEGLGRRLHHGAVESLTESYAARGITYSDIIYLVADGNTLFVFRDRQLLAKFARPEGAPNAPRPGVFAGQSYVSHGSITPVVYELVLREGRHRWGPVSGVPALLLRRAEQVGAADRERLLALTETPMATVPTLLWVQGDRPATGRGGSGGGKADASAAGAAEQQTEAGAAGRAASGRPNSDGAPAKPAHQPAEMWAHRQYRYVRLQLRIEHDRLEEIIRSSGNAAEATSRHIRATTGVPDRLALWARGDQHYINVWAGEGRMAVRMRQNDRPEVLWERLRTAARAVYANVKMMPSAGIADLEVAIYNADKTSDIDAVPPNAPPFSSHIDNYGPDVAIAGSVQDFAMKLNWAESGHTGGISEAMALRSYKWEVFRYADRRGRDELTARDATGQVDPRATARAASKGSRVGKTAGAKRRLGQTVDQIGDDMLAAEREGEIDSDNVVPASKEEFLTEAAVGVDAVIRLGGSLVSSFIGVATQPEYERSIPIPAPGFYVIRCTAARPPVEREPGNVPYVRAPSVAVYPLVVQSTHGQAVDATKDTSGIAGLEQQIGELEKQIEVATEEERIPLLRQLAALREELLQRQTRDANTLSYLGQSLASIDAQLKVLEEIEEKRQSGATDRNEWSNAARLLDVQLQLAHRSTKRFKDELELARRTMTKQKGAAITASANMRRHFRPHMAFVSSETGQTIPLTVLLGDESGDGSTRRWTLIDLSTPGHRDRYEGSSSKSGVEGDAEAIRRAFDDFSGDVPYGRGRFGVRLPEELRSAVPGVAIPRSVEARPDRGKRWRQRLTSLVSAAGAVALVATGPGAAALGLAGGATGAGLATYRIHRRYEGGYLTLDLETAMDIMSIVGGSLSSAQMLSRGFGGSLKLANSIERANGIYGYVELGSNVVTIPAKLAQQLAEIDKMEGLSDGERRARRAEAFLNATRSGLSTAIGTVKSIRELNDRRFASPEGRAGADSPGSPRHDTADPGSDLSSHATRPPRDSDGTNTASDPHTRTPRPARHARVMNVVPDPDGPPPRAQRDARTAAGAAEARARQTPTKPEPLASLVGKDVDTDTLAVRMGMLVTQVDEIAAYAAMRGVVVYVRPVNVHAPAHLGRGALPKDVAVKAKSVSDLDVRYLGATAGTEGLAAVFDPKMPKDIDSIRARSPELAAAIEQRHADRQRAFASFEADFGKYTNPDTGEPSMWRDPDTGVLHGLDPFARKGAPDEFKPFASDNDLYDVRANDGYLSRLSREAYQTVITELQLMGLVKHGAHMHMESDVGTESFEKGKKGWEKIRSGHQPGPSNEPLLRVGGGKPKASWPPPETDRVSNRLGPSGERAGDDGWRVTDATPGGGEGASAGEFGGGAPPESERPTKEILAERPTKETPAEGEPSRPGRSTAKIRAERPTGPVGTPTSVVEHVARRRLGDAHRQQEIWDRDHSDDFHSRIYHDPTTGLYHVVLALKELPDSATAIRLPKGALAPSSGWIPLPRRVKDHQPVLDDSGQPFARRADAMRRMRSLMRASPGREVGIVHNGKTGGYIVVQGATGEVGWTRAIYEKAGAPGEFKDWVFIEHSHPAQEQAGRLITHKGSRIPSPGRDGDISNTIRVAVSKGERHVERLMVQTPWGSKAVVFRYDPPKEGSAGELAIFYPVSASAYDSFRVWGGPDVALRAYGSWYAQYVGD